MEEQVNTEQTIQSDLLDYRQAAAYLRRSVNGLRKDVMLGRVPHIKPYGERGRVFFSRRQLDRWLEQKSIPAHLT
jgi:hypothetical protein